MTGPATPDVLKERQNLRWRFSRVVKRLAERDPASVACAQPMDPDAPVAGPAHSPTTSTAKTYVPNRG
jgi:hypothetical protein